MGLKAAVQALKKAEPLKDKVQRCKDLLNDNDAWMCQRQLQKIYQQVLILDLEYALDRKVEQELWNLGFKNYIAMLQSQAKDRRNPKRGESQVMLGWCLEAASGFYLTLLQEICTAFDLDLPFRRKSYVYGCISPWKAVEKLSAPHKSSCFYACQYCLVHLGDIARYRNQNKQAELFYRHAVSLSPSSGQPYNQLALLEASRGDKLGTVFHYVRSVSVKHPFPVASSNLSKTLSSALNDLSFNIERKTKLSSQEYISVFLKLHGVLYNLGDLSIAATYIKLMNDALTALVATESFSSWRLVQMLIINLYALQHTAGIIAENAELMKTDQLSADEKLSKNCILDLIAGNLSALLLPVYTIKNAVMNYFALPTIKLCLDWIQLRPTILEEDAFTSRLQIWPSLCVLLNSLQSCVADFDYNQYAKVPLPEDRDLQGFLPLEKSFEQLQFTNTDLEDDIAILNKLRAMRILQIGRQITQYQVKGATLISLGIENENEKPKFVSASEGIGLSNELIKELEELSLNKEKHPAIANSPVPSESASSKGSLEIESLIAEIGLEKRSGILKPQGSLERNRDSNDGGVENNSLPSSARRPRQNVAMQAIMRRAETEQKQVTFKNISPVMIEEMEQIKPVIVTSSVSPAKTSKTNKNIVVSAGSSNSIVNSGSIQPRQPLMSNAPLHINVKSVSTVQQQQLQLQQKPEQHLKQLDNHLSNVLPSPQQQQQENMILPSSSIGQFSHTDLQVSMMQGHPTYNQFSQQQQQQQQQQGQIAPNAACYSNQSFNAQAPQFNKNYVANSSTSLQHNSIATSMPGQFSSGQTPGTQAISFPPNININQNRLIQQQQRGNFSPLSQGSAILNQAYNLTPSAQPKQSTGQNIGISMPQNLSIHPSNLLTNAHRPLNGLNLSNHANMSAASYTAGLPETTISSTVPLNIQQQQLNFTSSNFSQNNFAQLTQQPPQKQISPTSYGNRQQPQFNYPNPTSLNQKNQSQQQQQPQQPMNNYPIFHGYDTKDFNLWKDQPPQPPMAWWGNNNMVAAGQIMQHQQQLNNEVPMVGNTDGFQNWANSSSQPAQCINNVPLTPGNNYPPQGRPYNGRSNFDEIRSFEVNQTQPQSAAMGSTYSLFSSNSWGTNGQMSSTSHQDQIKARLSQQSLWSGPGPSPLERLLEQQKSLREGGT